MTKSIRSFRVNPTKAALKEEGFTVPPNPGTKEFQGKPGVGQDIKLSDEEVIRSIITWAQFGLKSDGRAVGACTSEKIRKIFTDLLFEDMRSYGKIMDIGNSRHVYRPIPSATAAENSLNIIEAATLWEILGARELTIINLEVFLMNTVDQELIKLLKRNINELAYPELKKVEDVLKKEGFTVPPRPTQRFEQGTPGKDTKIILSDSEIIGGLIIGAQAAISQFVGSYCVALRSDIGELFRNFVSTEIEEYQKLMTLAVNRHALDNPPLVTSHRG